MKEMVKSKYDMIKKLKNDINSISFKTVVNDERVDNNIGIERKCNHIQSNSLTLLNPDGKKPWIYFDDIDVNNNILKFKNFNIIIELIEKGG